VKFDKYDIDGDYHWKWFRKKINPYPDHAKFCAGWVKERPCLDVGCGDGLITSLLGEGAEGVDNCKLAVELARSHHVIANVGSVYDLKCALQFASVFLGDVIEHLDSPETALASIRGALRDGGFLYISTPPKQATLSPYHCKEYTPEELVSLVTGFGFELVDRILVKPEWKEMYGKFRKA
jgi:2-polyprenyl-3-methyl-5-hydroxy-6-metoxy-1,4-benzoquinol methylase